MLGAFDTIFGSGTVTVQSLTGTGRLRITGATLSLSAASSIGALDPESGGTRDGAGTLTVSGAGGRGGGTLTFRVAVGGTPAFPGANVVTNAAAVELSGANSRIVNPTDSADALANFATNAAAGRFTIVDGRSFTSAGDFTNAGVVTVGAAAARSPAVPSRTRPAARCKWPAAVSCRRTWPMPGRVPASAA